MVLTGNSGASIRAQKSWDAFTKECASQLSMRDFGANRKVSEIHWVDVKEIGSAFHRHPLPSEGKRKAPEAKEEYGEKPYASPFCPYYRAKSVNTLKAHHRENHKNFEWVEMEPTVDTNSTGYGMVRSSVSNDVPLGSEEEKESQKIKKRRLDDNREGPKKDWAPFMAKMTSRK